MTRNPWLSRVPFHWAHQGGSREAPSNTLFAMRRARDAGCDGLEIDVHRTRDGKLVVCHDTSLDRTTSGSGPIAGKSLAEVQSCDSGYWWVWDKVSDHDPSTPPERYEYRGRGPADAAFQVPTLETVFEAFPGVPLNIELKRPGYEHLLVDLLVGTGRQDVIVVAFRDWSLRRFRKLAAKTGLAVATAEGAGLTFLFWLFSRVGIALPLHRTTVALQMKGWLGRVALTDRRFVKAAERRNVAVHAWTVDEAAEMAELLDLGVHGIMTDRPSVMARVVQERGPTPI